MADKPFYGGETPIGSEAIGGDRFYKGQGLGKITSWKCPSCAVENTGPLDAGCTACGAGSARASHVGVPPPPRKRGTTPLHGRPLDDDGAIEFSSPIDTAFKTWYAYRFGDNPELTVEDERFAREIWDAAIACYREYLRRAATVTDEPAPGEDPDIVAVPREVLIAVIKQLENTIDLPETDSQSPELLALISRIRELVE